jgi:hypothetical protein
MPNSNELPRASFAGSDPIQGTLGWDDQIVLRVFLKIVRPLSSADSVNKRRFCDCNPETTRNRFRGRLKPEPYGFIFAHTNANTTLRFPVHLSGLPQRHQRRSSIAFWWQSYLFSPFNLMGPLKRYNKVRTYFEPILPFK